MEHFKLLADRTRQMGASAIREILKVAQRPGMYSLAGGLPAPESFPLGLVPELMDAVLGRYGNLALQYGASEGFGPLRESLVDYLACFQIKAGAAEILITSGSQGLLDALGMILVSKGDAIAVEAPTYLGALQAFSAYEPVYRIVESDDQGVIPESLETVLADGKVKFIYLVPTFQNPTGRTLPTERRHAVARLIQAYDALLVEDDPYSALRYCGDAVPSIKSLAPEHVIYVGTLSKVFAPGLRIGFFLAPEPVRHWLVIAKQGIDLHTSTLNQALAAEYISGGHLMRHLPNIIALYRPRLAALLKALERFFPFSFAWSHPEGGMFLWAWGAPGMDMTALYHDSVVQNVAFVPGTYFYTNPHQGMETMRLNFSMLDEAALSHAASVLGELLHQIPV